MNTLSAIRRTAARSPAVMASVQKRHGSIELVSGTISMGCAVVMVWAYATLMPRMFQEKWNGLHAANVLPVFLAQEEKRNIAQLSKQLDSTCTKWERLPSAGAFRSASTRL